MLLVGRPLECTQIDALIDAARSGRSGALAISGEPGVGKTALLGYAAESAGGMRLLRTRGYEGEQSLPYAGLSALLAPLEREFSAIPAVQRRSLVTALRLGPARSIDRFAAYAATLSVLAAAAEQGPVLVVVDDYHWLDVDSAHALLFTARRLRDERVALLFGTRTHRGLDGVPRLALSGLTLDAASELLTATAATSVADTVAQRLHDVTAGNPLALVELAGALTAGQLAGSEPLDDPLGGTADLDEVFGERMDVLPADTCRALAVAAADDRATVEVLERALERVGLGMEAVVAAEVAGLVSMESGHVEFGHPLVRAAAYRRAGAPERRSAHLALAAALEGTHERHRRAWHLARGTLGPDEAVAAELEAVAGEARERGAPRAAAQALEQAARLTPVGESRTERLLQAARDHQLGGAPAPAGRLLDEALGAAHDKPLLRARIQHARVQGEFLAGSPQDMHELLQREAERVRPVDQAQATAMLIDAACLLAPAGDARELLRMSRQVAPHAVDLPGPAGPAARWLLACAEILAGDPSEGRRWLEQALPALRERSLATTWVATGLGACLLWLEDHERGRAYLSDLVDHARREGAILVLPYTLAHLADADLRLGRWRSAYALASESVSLAEDMRRPSEICHGLTRLASVEAGMGRAKECRQHGERALDLVEELGLRSIIHLVGSALGLLELGLGHCEAAIEHLEVVRRFAIDVGLEAPSITPWAQNLAEAYIRLDEPDRAEPVLTMLERQAKRNGGPLARAGACRCRGLAADDDDFEPHFRAALALHERGAAPFEHARTQLCFGERLRRAGRRTDARDELRTALATFIDLGAQPWADRASRELRATGERARRRAPDTADKLTPQELQVALRAANGATNKEVAAQLFISPRTVETHLAHVYRKLGVRSRVELSRRLGEYSDRPLAEQRVSTALST